MTIRVRMTERRASGAATAYEVGTEYDLADATARQFIHNGWATYVSGDVTPGDEVPVMAGVNATGGIAFSVAGSNFELKTGYRTVLFGDSMTDTFETISVPSALSYDPATGIMTVSNSGHQQAVGWYVTFFHRSYRALIAHQRLPVLTAPDANTFTINVGANLSGVPSGSVSASGAMYRPESWRSAQGFVTWLNALSGQRFNVVYNGAQSGDTVAQALARIKSHCLDYNPHTVICQMPGINDMSTGNGPIDEETIHSGRCSIVSRLAASASKVIVLATTPVYTGEARATLQNMARLIRINNRLRDYCKGVPGVIFFDAYAQIIDPTSATGIAKANVLRTTDNVHYSMRGANLIASQLWSAIRYDFPSTVSSLPTSLVDSFYASRISLTSVSRSNNVITATASSHGFITGEKAKVVGGSEPLNDIVTVTRVDANTISFPSSGADGSITGTIYLGRGDNLMDNCLLTTGTGGTVVASASGTAASKIKVLQGNGTPTMVASVVARSDGYGNDQQVVITATAANDQGAIEADLALASTDLPTYVKAGRTYTFECEMTLSGVSGSNLTEIRPNLYAIVGGTIYQTYSLNGYSDGAALNTDQAALHIKTAPMLLPSGSVTNFKWIIYLRFSAAGSALTVKVGRIVIRESAT